MCAAKTSLDGLRREIDEIDSALHDLLMRRAELVREIGAAKGDGGSYIRPGREAQVLRRLVGRHRGVFPKPVLVRIWREIISVFAGLQGPLAVAVYAAEGAPDLRTRARDHFGSLTPVTEHGSTRSVVRAVSEGSATIGLLPVPEIDDVDPWWRLLANNGKGTPRIIARVPFVSMEPALPNGAEGLAVALVPTEASGADRSYIVIETAEPVSRPSLAEQLARSGLQVHDIQHWDSPEQRLHLVEIAGYIDDDDPRLGSLGINGGEELRVWPIGGYAIPLTAEELAYRNGEEA